MKFLILGGNGFIGFEVARSAARRGHTLVCIGRNIAAAKTKLPSANWISADISALSNPSQWHPYLDGIDAVINCSGALQSGSRDNLEATQFTALCALFKAMKDRNTIRIVQISANTMSGQKAGELGRVDELPHVYFAGFAPRKFDGSTLIFDSMEDLDVDEDERTRLGTCIGSISGLPPVCWCEGKE